jgi:hypothetical protein
VAFLSHYDELLGPLKAGNQFHKRSSEYTSQGVPCAVELVSYLCLYPSYVACEFESNNS